ncbi:hypothetical protein PspLS_06212 [Pyricularia sp. CBS 133598]|nr:hypothetical protein PspLS_06212 [Pyricularia sp. CBS 133598]
MPTRDARELEMARAAARLLLRDKGGRCEARYCLFDMEAEKEMFRVKVQFGAGFVPRSPIHRVSMVGIVRTLCMYLSSAI